MSDKNGKEEKIHRFYNMTVKFLITPSKHGKSVLSYTCVISPGETFADVWNSYSVNGNIDYARKIVENTIIALDSIAIDSSDIDSCLRKAFSLRKKHLDNIPA